MSDGGSLNWALCVSTLERLPVLVDCVKLALAQTRPPKEILVCDASTDFDTHAKVLGDLVGKAPGVDLTCMPARRRSLTVQRNQSIEAATADILFLIDDDSFMFPDCAERIMKVYDADHAQQIAAVAAVTGRGDPRADTGDPDLRRTKPIDSNSVGMRLRRTTVGRAVEKHPLMSSGEHAFVAYDDGVSRPTYDRYAAQGLPSRDLIAGFSLTVRRNVACAFPFDAHLLAYCPLEDADASHRYRRKGLLVAEPEAFLYHLDAAGGRLKRRKVMELQVTNMAYLIRKHSVSPYRDVPRFALRMARRLLAETLRDTLMRRFSYPQLRGVASGILRAPVILARDRKDLGIWYERVRESIMSRR